MCAAFLLPGTALAQGALGMEITANSERIAAGGTVSFQVRAFNKTNGPLQGSLNVSVSMEGATFANVSSSNPALICTKAPGSPEKYNCGGQGFTLAPSASVTISLTARVPRDTPQGARRTLIGTAVGFSGQVASGLFLLTVAGVAAGPSLQVILHKDFLGDAVSIAYPLVYYYDIHVANEGDGPTEGPWEVTLEIVSVPEGGDAKVLTNPVYLKPAGDRLLRYNGESSLSAGQTIGIDGVIIGYFGRGLASVTARVTGGGSPPDEMNDAFAATRAEPFTEADLEEIASWVKGRKR
jgi:hypothetical protein